MKTSTSALTWAAAQQDVSVYELLRGLTSADERRIELAYAEWRRCAAAGERVHRVDWRTYPMPSQAEGDPARNDDAEQEDGIETVERMEEKLSPAIDMDGKETVTAAAESGKLKLEYDRMRRKREMIDSLRDAGIPVCASDYPDVLEYLGVVNEDDRAILRSITTDCIFQRKRNGEDTASEEAFLSWLNSFRG